MRPLNRMWQQLHYRECGREKDRERESAREGKSLHNNGKMLFAATCRCVYAAICVCSCISSCICIFLRLLYMCCLHAAILQLLLFAFVCSAAFKKFTIQFFPFLPHTHTHTPAHTFLAVCLGTWHAFRIAFCIEFINI